MAATPIVADCQVTASSSSAIEMLKPFCNFSFKLRTTCRRSLSEWAFSMRISSVSTATGMGLAYQVQFARRRERFIADCPHTTSIRWEAGRGSATLPFESWGSNPGMFRSLRQLLAVCPVLLSFWASYASANETPGCTGLAPKDCLTLALNAMGGQEKLEAIHSVYL